MQSGRQHVGDARTAEDRGEGADQGDAHLDDGQEMVRVLGQLQGLPRCALAGLGFGLQAAAARGDDGHLRTGEEAIGQGQGQDDDQGTG